MLYVHWTDINMFVNVDRTVPDQFCRYKMPRIVTKVEGKGNGIKTVVPNMPEISKALSRPPTYICKFFGYELGTQTHADFKNDRYVINGSHDRNKLQDILDVFIRKFVLCPNCDNPETRLRANRNEIWQFCTACGHQDGLDVRHKLTAFILKNPPDVDPSRSGSRKTDRKVKRSQQKPLEKRNMDLPDDGEDLDAVKESLASDVKGLTLNDGPKQTLKERLDIFYRFVKKKKDENKIAGADKDACAEAERLGVKEKAPIILAEILLDEKALKQFRLYRLHFLRLVHDSPKSQRSLLGGFEQLCALYEDKLMPKVPVLLETMYDLDLIEEDVIQAWARKPFKKYVSEDVARRIREKAAPFLKWLAEAEEEEYSDGEV